MAQLSDQQIATIAKGAGFSSKGLVIAIAVCLAESHGVTNATGYNRSSNGTITSVDRGLWQINSVYHAEVSDACAYDAQCCAKAAYVISSHGQDWSPWSTYKSGAYTQYTARALAVSGVSTQSPTGAPLPPSTTNSSGGDAVGGTQNLVYTPVTTADIVSTTTETLGTGNSNTAYRWVLAFIVMGGFVMLLMRTRAGYAALYYAELLILLFLFATQSQFIVEALTPFTGVTQPTSTN